MGTYDVAIIGSGPAGLGAAFELLARRPGLSVLILDRNEYSSGGLRNDCKMNFSWPIGFPDCCWTMGQAEAYLGRVEAFLEPRILEKRNLSVYAKRAEKIGVRLLEIRQSHLGTDGGLELIKRLMARLEAMGAELSLGERAISVDPSSRRLRTDRREIAYRDLVVAPGRGGFSFLQEVMNGAGVGFTDNAVDVGVRIETRQEHTTPSSSSPRRPAPSAPIRAPPTSSRRSTRRRTGAPGSASTATPGRSPGRRLAPPTASSTSPC
jgi:predicted flavoprotein YhiN